MVPPLLQRVKALGHRVFTSGDWNLNLVGIRSRPREANTFDDTFTCTYRENGQWITRYWECTTDPGTYWLENPSRVEGTAILHPGQYRNVYKIDKHRGQYDALCQRNGEVKVYRDDNKDEVLDMNPETTTSGFFGINIHRAGRAGATAHVERYSAGCQVLRDSRDFDMLMSIARKQIENRGWDTFTYTLIED